MEKVAEDWGFKDQATAEAFMRARRKRLGTQQKHKRAAKLRDPHLRLQKLKEKVEEAPVPQPQLRPHARMHETLHPHKVRA